VGLFLATTAVRDTPIDALRDAIADWTAAAGESAEPTEEPHADDRDIAIATPAGGWTVVVWPTYFNDVPAARDLSAALGTLVSSVHVYDGDFWVHTLCRGGELLDRFASVPDYFEEDEEAMRRTFAGSAEAIGAAVGVEPDKLAPYLVHLGVDDEPGKVRPEDEAELWDVWVFADFWRRLGIEYPARPDEAAVRLRMPDGWFDRLASQGELAEL
jgi:hypothetical protein